MQTPKQFYQTQVSVFQEQLAILKKQLLQLSILRFLVFLLIIGSIVFVIKCNTYFGIATFIFLGVFVFLILKHQSLQKDIKHTEAKLDLNKTELKVLDKDFKHLDAGTAFLNPKHFFSHDIDLFGIGSFFQYINRTATSEGKQLLADTLTSNNTENINNKQEALAELAQKTTWRQDFYATAKTVENTKACLLYTSPSPRDA